MAIKQNFPDIKPSLNLDFANTKSLDPRIDFTRATPATYYDGETFAKAEENLLKYSQEFDNASGWSFLSDANLTANTAIAPDGTTTAYELTPSVSSGKARVGTNETPSDVSVYTFSVFIKANTHNYIQINGLAGDGEFANFDLLNKVVGNKTPGTSASLTELTNGWFRCVFTTTKEISPAIQIIEQADVDNSGRAPTVSYDGTESIFIWGAQLEQRDQLTAYTPTTDQPITNYIPVLETASTHEPRFDHDPVTGESKGLLIEEQRTNLLSYSEQFDNAFWDKEDLSISINFTIAPDGTLTADKLIPNTNLADHRLFKSGFSLSTNSHSVYAKAGEYTKIVIGDAGGQSRLCVDLTDGSVVHQNAVDSYSVIEVGNGWYRISITFAGNLGFYGIAVVSDAYVSGSVISGNDFAGDGYSGIYIWGAQLEEGSFPTSYIKTEGSQVTRVADSASITGENFSEWYRQDEGTVFVEYDHQTDRLSGEILRFLGNGGVSNNNISFRSANGETNLAGIIKYNNDIVVNFGSADSISDGINKAAFAFGRNDAALSITDFDIQEDASATLPRVDKLDIGVGSFNSGSTRISNTRMKRLTYYPKRLPNTVLQALTKD